MEPRRHAVRHTTDGPTDEEREQLAARDVAVVEGEVARLEVADDRVVGLRLVAGDVVPVEVLVVGAPAVARDGFLVGVGLLAEDLE